MLRVYKYSFNVIKSAFSMYYSRLKMKVEVTVISGDVSRVAVKMYVVVFFLLLWK